MTELDENTAYAPVCRKKYGTPKLLDFGKVRDLTTGGSAATTENDMVINTMGVMP